MSIAFNQLSCSKASLANFSQLSNQAQAQIFKGYCNGYYQFVYSIVRNHHSTEDILQEAFLRIITRNLSHVHDDKLHGWIFTITRNTTLNDVRKQKKHGFVTNIKELQAEATSNPSMSSEWDYFKSFESQAVRQFISELAPNLRTIMFLRFVQQFSNKEIAAALHMSEGAVRQHLYRGRKMIKERYLHDFKET